MFGHLLYSNQWWFLKFINFLVGFCISNLSSIPRHLREYTAPFAAKVVGLIPDLKENPPAIDVDVPGIVLYDFSIYTLG